jgi:hypothetical protein
VIIAIAAGSKGQNPVHRDPIALGLQYKYLKSQQRCRQTRVERYPRDNHDDTGAGVASWPIPWREAAKVNRINQKTTMASAPTHWYHLLPPEHFFAEFVVYVETILGHVNWRQSGQFTSHW